MVAGAVLSPHSTNGGLNSDKCRLVQGFFSQAGLTTKPCIAHHFYS